MLSAARGFVRRSQGTLLRPSAVKRALAPRVFSASFHSSIPRFEKTDDESAAAVAASSEDEVGNDGILGELFGNPYYAVPIGGVGFMSAVQLDWYVFNEETQLLALWCLFVGTVYHNFGSGIASFFDDIANGIKNEQLAQEDAIIQAMKVTRDAHARQTEIYGDIKSIFEAQQELMDIITASKSKELKHKLRDQVVSRLDNLVAIEERAVLQIKDDLVNKTTEKVRAAITTDEIKKAALDQAFKAIADPSAPAGEDPVAALYTKSFQEFNARVQQLAAEPVELTPEIKAEALAEMKAVAAREDVGADIVNAVEIPTHIKVSGL